MYTIYIGFICLFIICVTIMNQRMKGPMTLKKGNSRPPHTLIHYMNGYNDVFICIQFILNSYVYIII